jgi:hypothetical protein
MIGPVQGMGVGYEHRVSFAGASGRLSLPVDKTELCTFNLSERCLKGRQERLQVQSVRGSRPLLKVFEAIAYQSCIDNQRA